MAAVACGGCHRRYEVNERYAGKTVKCAYCGQPMPIPVAKPVGFSPASAPAHDEYQLGEPVETEPSAFQASPERRREEQAARSDRPRKNTRKRSKKRESERAGLGEYFSLRVMLISVGVAAVVLALLTVLMPTARKPVGVAIALPGLLLCLYGYSSAVYIAFTEDDLYGWLCLLFPFYAAYYVVSRWDDMRSRLIMVVAGLVMLAIGARMLEADRAEAESKKETGTIERNG